MKNGLWKEADQRVLRAAVRIHKSLKFRDFKNDDGTLDAERRWEVFWRAQEDITLDKAQLAALSLEPSKAATIVPLLFCFTDGEEPSSVEWLNTFAAKADAWVAKRDAASARSWLIATPATALVDAGLLSPKATIISNNRSFTILESDKIGGAISEILNNKDLLNSKTRGAATRAEKYILTTEWRGSHWLKGWKDSSSAFNLLRSVIEFALSYGRWTYAMGQKSRAMLPHPKWLAGISVADNIFDGTCFETDVLTEIKDHKQYKLEHLSKNVRRLSPIVAKPFQNGSLRELICDCLLLHYKAHESRFDHWAFLGFWQVLERAALVKDKGGATGDVANRVAWLVKPRLGDVDGILAHYGQLRNNLTHSGVADGISWDEVNIIKEISEESIMQLIRKRKHFINQGTLKAIYEHRTQSDTNLDTISQAVISIKKLRSLT